MEGKSMKQNQVAIGETVRAGVGDEPDGWPGDYGVEDAKSQHGGGAGAEEAGRDREGLGKMKGRIGIAGGAGLADFYAV